MKSISTIFSLFFLFISIPLTLSAQSETFIFGIQLDQPLEVVKEKLESISESPRVISVETPRFPLAEYKEEHLVCSNVTTANGIIDKVVFTFADEKLSYIEAHGNVVAVLTSKRKDTAKSYMDYKFYPKDMLFINPKKDIAWLINEEAVHVNLFTWENPYLDPGYTPKPVTVTDIPAFLKMGASLEELKPLLEANSSFTATEELDGSDPNAQLQVNCFGVDYLGFPRKVEARFGDGQLNTVWILTAKGEENRIRKALIKSYGDPIFTGDAWEIFNNWQVGLRKDKPEILLLTQKLGLHYKSELSK